MKARTKYRDYANLVKLLYVSVVHFDEPIDARHKKANAVRLEADCIAEYSVRFGAEPEFNQKLWPKFGEEFDFPPPYACIFDDRVAAEEFIERVTKIVGRMFRLESVEGNGFRVAEGEAIPRRPETPIDEPGIDAYLGQTVTITDHAGNKYSGTLEKNVIRIVGYSIKGKKPTEEPLKPEEIAEIVPKKGSSGK